MDNSLIAQELSEQLNHKIDLSKKQSIIENQGYKLADQYAHDVLHGKIPAGKLMQLQCQEYVLDRFDESIVFINHAKQFAAFLSTTVFPEGEMARFRHWHLPFNWMMFVQTFCFFQHEEDDNNKLTRKTSECAVMMARGNAKTSWCTPIIAYEMMSSPLGMVKCGSVATTQLQANIISKYMRTMTTAPNVYPITASLFKHTGNKTNVGDSEYRAFPASEDILNGQRQSLCIADETHLHKSNGLVQTILDGQTGQGHGSLCIKITTAGDSELPVAFGDLERTHCKLVDKIPDPNYTGYMYMMDKEDVGTIADINVEAMIKANPAIGYAVTRKSLRASINAVIMDPTKKFGFLTKKCCIFHRQEESVFIEEEYIDQIYHPELDIKDYDGRKVHLSLDSAKVRDWCSINLIFDSTAPNKKWDIFTLNFIPLKSVNALPEKYRQKMFQLEDAGNLIIVDGEITEPIIIRKYLKSFYKKYKVASFGFDPSGVQDSMAILENDLTKSQAAKMYPCRQTLENMSGAARMLQAELSNNTIRTNCSSLIWGLRNSSTYTSADGRLIRIIKKNEHAKIDTVVSLCCGLFPFSSGQLSSIKRAKHLGSFH